MGIRSQFMEACINRSVTVFLNNGVKLEGVIIAFCNDCFILYSSQHETSQMVITAQVSTIMPKGKLDLVEICQNDKLEEILDLAEDEEVNGNVQ